MKDIDLELFRFAIDRLSKGTAVPALCKEDQSLWQALGLTFKGCHCLLDGQDRLAARNGASGLLFPKLRPAAAALGL